MEQRELGWVGIKFEGRKRKVTEIPCPFRTAR
jgi:hypothetical protein